MVERDGVQRQGAVIVCWKKGRSWVFLQMMMSFIVCVYYCSTYYKAVREGGGGRVEDMCYGGVEVTELSTNKQHTHSLYERLRAEAYVN
jgi:hypothetical protein